MVDAARLRTLLTELQRHLTNKCGHRYGRSYLVLEGGHDPLDERMTLADLAAGLIVPAGCGFTGIYLVVPRFETPRRFVLLARRLSRARLSPQLPRHYAHTEMQFGHARSST